MDAKKEFFEHYDYITKIVKFKTHQYDLDYDGALNFVLGKICADDYKILRAFRGEGKFTTFLHVVVSHMIFRYAGNKRKLPEMPTMVSETPLDVLINQQHLECKEKFLKKLPTLLDKLKAREKVIIKMKYFEDNKLIQISRILNITKYEIYKSLNASLEFFREKIKEICKK